MKALVYVGEEKLDFREVADPVVNSGEQLIKVDSAGICGFFFQAEDGIRDFCLSRGLGDVYKRQLENLSQTQWLQIERGVKALMKEYGPDIPLESLKAMKHTYDHYHTEKDVALDFMGNQQ